MGCHRIGLGMNSVVKEAIEMFENEEIGLNACKKIIMACKNGVYWCDDRNKYFVVRNYICKSCYDHLVCDYVLNSRLLERKIMEKTA